MSQDDQQRAALLFVFILQELPVHQYRLVCISDLADPTDEDPDIYTKWEAIKNTYVETATKVLGFRQKNNKVWLTTGTWQKIEQRKLN